MKNILKITIMALFIIAGAGAISGADACLTAKANHDDIKIDFFYNGSEVSVSGFSDPDVDLIVKLTSPEGHQALKKKGKTGGFLWMNVGELKFDNVPNVYYLQSTRKPEDLLPAADLDSNVIGFASLERHAEVGPVSGPEEKSKWFGEFLRYKEHNNLYYQTDGGFAMKEGGPQRHYYMKFAWPYQAPPGNYDVMVYAVKNGKILETATSKVVVEQVGAVKTLADMAKNNGAVYGILSILAAVVSGFGVGLVFGKGGGAH